MAVAIFPSEVLWILGKDYAGLDAQALLTFNSLFAKITSDWNIAFFVSPVVLMTAGSCMSLIAGAAFTLNSSRGLVITPLFAIPFSILSQVFFLLIFDLSQVIGVLAISLLVNIFQALMHVIYFRIAK